jgi:Sulfatase
LILLHPGTLGSGCKYDGLGLDGPDIWSDIMQKESVLLVSLMLVGAAGLVAFFVPITVGGQESPAPPGVPTYTEALHSKALPPPPPQFGGEIKPTAAESKPWWPPRTVEPKGVPNVLLIMLDDAGYGSESTFGGTIPTPALDRIAQAGLRYTMFHSAALCSPTRAALITGRNHHSVHFGIVAEGATGFPGYDTIVKKDTATIAEILRQNGYGTSSAGCIRRRARSLSGRSVWASSTSTASLAVTRASGSRTSSATRRQSRHTRAIRPGTSSPQWPTTRSSTCIG